METVKKKEEKAMSQKMESGYKDQQVRKIIKKAAILELIEVMIEKAKELNDE